MESNLRKTWLDILKIFACFCVLINHTVGFILEKDASSVVNNVFYIIQFSLCKVGVPLFVMTTGVLILNRKYKFKDVLRKIPIVNKFL